MSVFRFQDLAIRLPDTRNLTPIYIISVFAAPQGPIFPSVVSEKALNLYLRAAQDGKISPLATIINRPVWEIHSGIPDGVQVRCVSILQ